jgi:hypothetical protein
MFGPIPSRSLRQDAYRYAIRDPDLARINVYEVIGEETGEARMAPQVLVPSHTSVPRFTDIA